jgi:hypothetical protein
MKKVKLPDGKVVLVDDEDFEWITHWKWHSRVSGKHVCAVRVVYVDGRKAGKYTVLMHRVIMGAPENMAVDHINGDPLDNRKSNLRVCTAYENSLNRRVGVNNTSGYKGVHLHTKLKRWTARIGANGKRLHLGLFDTPEEAAKAYNLAAVQHHGKFAKLNDIG